ncbi:unnamed protein product [Prorocentrum cordatum]|uniref:Uncharacterized protein n=1 Tax=Prorocentrum cordatum TaxID=2364126 RepID=A0ABN9QZS5_9DINO|nr:unnamed protein product [Polarella glacialis]
MMGKRGNHAGEREGDPEDGKNKKSTTRPLGRGVSMGSLVLSAGRAAWIRALLARMGPQPAKSVLGQNTGLYQQNRTTRFAGFAGVCAKIATFPEDVDSAAAGRGGNIC